MERKKALVIDDEQIVLDSVKKILSQENFDVDIASSSRVGSDLRSTILTTSCSPISACLKSAA